MLHLKISQQLVAMIKKLKIKRVIGLGYYPVLLGPHSRAVLCVCIIHTEAECVARAAAVVLTSCV